jgi:hypothetical protein
MFYIFSAASALFDLTVGLLPIMLVRKLQMNIQTKAAVVGLLGMACVYVSLLLLVLKRAEFTNGSGLQRKCSGYRPHAVCGDDS